MKKIKHMITITQMMAKMSGMIISPMSKVLRSARNLAFGENELVQWMLRVSLRNLAGLGAGFRVIAPTWPEVPR